MRTHTDPIVRSRTAFALPSLALLVALTLAPTARAGGPPTVAILPATTSASVTDVHTRLQATGLFAQVDVILASSVTPTLAQLQAYDAVLTWSNNNYADSTALGNVLADYVDAGGGVVVGIFANSTVSANRYLLGRWTTGYEVIVSQGGTQTGAATLGVIHDPSHPVMMGVTSFIGGSSSYRPVSTTLTAGSTVVASWSDGRVLVAQGAQANRVDLGFYPSSSTSVSTSWDPSTDGAKMMANALVHVATQNIPAPVPYCAGDGTGTACPCGNSGAAGNGCASSVSVSGANLTTSGVPSITNDTLVLKGTIMPSSSALYFQGTTRVNGGLGAPFGDGLRCVGGSVVRLKIKTNVAGASQFPGAGDPLLSVRGGLVAPGTRYYQVWYRNAQAFCTPSTFNLTNGVQVDWVN